MRDNANLTLESDNVALVPYRPEHVRQYHSWMEDCELLEATASERLSLEEEYDMQRNWAEDADKCTFIVLDPALPDRHGTGAILGGMAGDVNLFFNDPEAACVTAEIEVMIAKKACRRRGLAADALRLLMAYAVADLGVRKFRAKIGEQNTASLALFQKRLGYTEVSRSTVFQEVTLELQVDMQDLTESGKALWVPQKPYRRGTYDQQAKIL